MAEIEFIYDKIKLTIQCKLNEKMKDICAKFENKINLDKNINLFYSYEGKTELNLNLSFEQIANNVDKERKKMSVIVYANKINLEKECIIRPKNIICPECKENIRMDIIDYKIKLHDCINNHTIDNILLNEFDELQKIDKTKIINNDDKYYICNKHNKYYISLCNKCKINMCELCDNHQNHEQIYYKDIIPPKELLNKKLKIFKKYIALLNNNINSIISVLNDVKNKMDIYYNIYKNMINNYNNQKNNMEILYNLRQFLKEKDIIKEIENINECNFILDKFKNIYNIYKKMNIDEIKILYRKDFKRTRLFGQDFVERNKDNCFLIIE